MNLESVKNYLVLNDGWDSDKFDKISQIYVNFLDKASESSKITKVPSLEVDAIWHAHILHTKDYREFCNERYGKIIDHVPFSDSEIAVTDLPCGAAPADATQL